MRKVSVITVVLNGVGKIEDTLKSVMEQSQDDVEYIIIDGGSTDGTVDIIRRYENALSYWLSEPDLGIYDAMNKGLDHVTGDIVVFLNAGDRFHDNDVLSRIYKRFNEEPGTDILICKEIIEGKVCKTYLDRNNESIYFGAFFPHQATFSKTKLYREYGVFSEEYRICADYDWVLGAYYRGYSLRWCDDVVSIYDSSGVSSSYESIAEQYLISSKYLKLSGNENLLQDSKQHYLEVFERSFFRDLIRRNENNDLIRECLSEIIYSSSVDIWGAGYVGRLLNGFLSSNGVRVDHILDSDPTKHGAEYDGIRVCGFDKTKYNFIIISTTDYEREVAAALKDAGLCENKDYLTFTGISALVTRFLIENGYDDGGFFEKTGIDYE